MIATGLQPYPADTRNPGVPWLGEVPRHGKCRCGLGRDIEATSVLEETGRRSPTGAVHRYWRRPDLITTRLKLESLHPGWTSRHLKAVSVGDCSAGSGETPTRSGNQAVLCSKADAVGGGDGVVVPSARVKSDASSASRLGLQPPPKGQAWDVRHCHAHLPMTEAIPIPAPSAARTSGDRPLPRPRRPADPARDPRQAEADRAAERAEAGRDPPRRHARPRSERPLKPSGADWLGDVPSTGHGSRVQSERRLAGKTNIKTPR